MVKNSKIKLIIFVIIPIIFLISDCANQLPPGGGEVDKIPPKIKSVYPEDGTTNFKDDYFELEFSEYVDKRTFKDAIFISPAIEGNLETDWTGTTVTVNFPEKLKDNITYVVTIGTDVVDYNNKNRMEQAFSFTFSTGNKIDHKIISGKVYSGKPDGIFIFAYKTINKDTLNPAKIKPDYISQTGKDGTFKLLGLSEGIYRVFAVNDQYKDLLFQAGQDKIGMPFKDISMSENDTLFSNLNFFLTSADTTKPRLLNAVMTDEQHVLVTLTKDYDSTIIRADNFQLIDSTTNEIIKPKYAFKGRTKKDELVLAIQKNIPVENSVYLKTDTLKDKLNNVYLNDFTSLTISDKPDTTRPNIFRTIPSMRSSNVDYKNPKFKVFLDDAINVSKLKQNITFSDTLNTFVPFMINTIDDASFIIKPIENIKPQTDYLIKINLNKMPDIAGNVRDSVYIIKFRTTSGLDFTGAAGSVYNINLNNNPVLVLENTSTPDRYQKVLNGSSKFNFDRINPGKYLLWCYYDRDSSGTYTYGWPYPFKPSEEFSFYPDTLNLRARWIITDVKFLFKE